jgi:hypothetical protein
MPSLVGILVKHAQLLANGWPRPSSLLVAGRGSPHGETVGFQKCQSGGGTHTWHFLFMFGVAGLLLSIPLQSCMGVWPCGVWVLYTLYTPDRIIINGGGGDSPPDRAPPPPTVRPPSKFNPPLTPWDSSSPTPNSRISNSWLIDLGVDL